MLFQNEHSLLASEALGHFMADFFAMRAALCIAHDSWHQLDDFHSKYKRLKCSSLFAISRAFELIKLNIPLRFFLGFGTRFYAFLKREWLSHFNCALLPTASRGGFCLHRLQCLCFVSLCTLLPERCRYTVWNAHNVTWKLSFTRRHCQMKKKDISCFLTWNIFI